MTLESLPQIRIASLQRTHLPFSPVKRSSSTGPTRLLHRKRVLSSLLLALIPTRRMRDLHRQRKRSERKQHHTRQQSRRAKLSRAMGLSRPRASTAPAVRLPHRRLQQLGAPAILCHTAPRLILREVMTLRLSSHTKERRRGPAMPQNRFLPRIKALTARAQMVHTRPPLDLPANTPAPHQHPHSHG